MRKVTTEQNVQMLVYLLKEHGIKRIIVSPGSANCNFVYTVQTDPYFELYSAVDERSAAYMACGMSFESNEPVVITCTGATASRNYFPGLSEAYHRKLPVLAVTASQDLSIAGHLSPQFIDRSQHPVDTVMMSVNLQNINSETDCWDCNIKINKAILELKRHGGGPVHINLCTLNTNTYIDSLPSTRVIRRYVVSDIDIPVIKENKRIAITIGGHKPFDDEEINAIDKFCEEHDAVVFCDHSSQYKGNYWINPSVIAAQEYYQTTIFDIDLLIHIGEEHGDYYTNGKLRPKEVWRVSEDGEIRDSFKMLSSVFEMREIDFFRKYIKNTRDVKRDYYDNCCAEKKRLIDCIKEIPFSNVWLAYEISNKLPINSTIQLGVSNTQRAWTFFDFPKSVISIANVGCRGIDGTISTVLGMALSSPDRIHFSVMGDLSFFYDMNTLGNRHFPKNLRLILVNNGIGAEFKIYHNRVNLILGDETNPYLAAEGHFGNKSTELVKHFCNDLGIKYYSATNKMEAKEALNDFLAVNVEEPMLLEVFTIPQFESDAIKKMRNLSVDQSLLAEAKAKNMVKRVLGARGSDFVKRMIKG